MAKHEKMDRAQRAKQFIPFAALDGLEEALVQKEIENSKKNLLNSRKKKINVIKSILFNLSYNETHYLDITYEDLNVKKITCLNADIQIDENGLIINKVKIPYQKIIELSILEN